jgi:DnaJ-class molecular chaperone
MAMQHAVQSATLADVLKRVLDKGVVIAGDIKISPEAALPGGREDNVMGQGAIDETRTTRVRCAFCHGTGKDPFPIMSSLWICWVCLGRGTVAVEVPYERCAHCRGTGAVKRLTCRVCGGRGVLPALEGSTEVCPKCRGKGDDQPGLAMACLECRGRGRIPAEAADKRANARQHNRQGAKG